jgi:hypothetical protein
MCIKQKKNQSTIFKDKGLNKLASNVYTMAHWLEYWMEYEKYVYLVCSSIYFVFLTKNT